MQDKNGDPAIGISVQAEVEPGRTVVVQTHVGQDVSGVALDALLDKIADRLDRQMAKFSIIKLRKQKEANETKMRDTARIDQEEDDKAKADYGERGRRGELRLSQAQTQAKHQRREIMQRCKDEIAAIDALIKECEEKIGKPGPKIAA
jgi:hypothetical protein